MAGYKRVEDLDVYNRLCDLHIEISDETRHWPFQENFELASQVRRSSNSAPANLAEKHGDQHIRNWLEGINRARGETQETIHHLYIAYRRGYMDKDHYEDLRARLHECVKMLIGLHRTMSARLPPSSSR